MEVRLSAEALQELNRKGKVLTIFQGEYSGCCVGKVPALMADLRPPLGPQDQYKFVQVNDINIYIEKK